MKLEVLFEDNHCLVVNKPAGLLSQADVTGDPSVVSWAKDDLKARYRKPGNVYVGLVHRLDRPTSGVVLLARTSKAASRLSAQFRAGAGRESLLGHRRGRAGGGPRRVDRPAGERQADQPRSRQSGRAARR